MPKKANPIRGRQTDPEPYTEFEKSFMDNDLYICWYDRTIMHWSQDHVLDEFYQEQIVIQEKSTGKYFWPHGNQLLPVTSLENTMSFDFFRKDDIESSSEES